ncbi:MAG: helix-turn-helix transcriptional regulator [Candidatus Coproplasma sp.]
MFDDLNENKDNLTQNTTSQEEGNTTAMDNEESTDAVAAYAQESLNSSAQEAENAIAQEGENTSALNENDGSTDAETDSPSASRTEENNSISADLIRGHINTIILRALYERDKYGYEIINDIESKSHGQYTLKQPTLYSALKRLENQGYIKAYWKTDEVTLGGRRKYFKLTESGKAITEKNLAEWEYSRTIIDSLISDKSFDFANPAPTAVDFSLLRDSVSRVPTVKADDKPTVEGNQPRLAEPTAQQIISQHPTQTTDSVSYIRAVEYVSTNGNEKENKSDNQPDAQTQENGVQTTLSQNNTTLNESSQGATAQNATQENATQQQAAPESRESEEEAARRRTHENYMRLISEPVRPKPVQAEDTVPGSDNINSDKLLYNNRPETERDYRNLIDGIFFKTVYNGSVQTTYHSRPAETSQPHQTRRTANSTRLVDMGASDGVSITPSNERSGARASKTTYNKGLTLLKSSAVVLAILIVEAILCYIFMEPLAINWVYPTVILSIGILQFAVFTIMSLNGFGKHSVLPTNHSYISTCIILTIIAVLIIAMLSFLLNMNTAVLSDILKMLVIPAVTALNLTVFGLCFKAFIK